ncbi:hypothetical protein SDC9_166823 [bioreactor metagenome]|uniref:Uncharacterized protein n=1 Tax=bioreactor metagenome TaxID=1076179 RepID=A0A645G5N7_9ZZZZ
MNCEENPREVQQCGDCRRQAHLQIGNAQVFRDDKRRRAHDRRHDLPSHRRRRFHGAGKMGLIPDLFHEGDRKRADGTDIRDGGTADHSEQAARDDRGFGRPADLPAESA